MIEQLIASGRLFDIILIGVAVEALLLGWIATRWTTAPPLATLLPNLLSGAALMAAVRFAVTDSDWKLIAAALAAALIFHITDLVKRYRAV